MRNQLLILFALLTIPFVGCGQKLPPGMPPLTPCTITVTMDGKPVDEARIAFYSTDLKFACSGFTGDTGTTRMMTDGKYRGVPAGKYKVLVTKIFVEEREYKGFLEEAKLPPKKREAIIDLLYEDEEQTPFEIEITQGKSASMTCEVKAPENPELPADYGMKIRNR